MYEGNWENDRYQGWGVYRYTNGTEYRGEWVEDMKHGKGIEI